MVYSKFDLNKKGQLSIEFILVILVVLVLIETIVLPLRDYSENSINDMISLNSLEKNYDNIYNAINDLQAYSEGKYIIKLNVPEDANIFIYSKSLAGKTFATSYDYIFSLRANDINSDACVDNICYGSKALDPLILISPGTIYVPGPMPISTSGFAFYGENNYELELLKQNNVLSLTVK